MKNKKLSLYILGFILVVAALLRFWQLGLVPISPDWDEAALGYNAYSIMQTGRDEYGDFLPVVLQSFGDYKPALYTYTIIPFIPLFDLTVLAVRLPSAIAGVIAVFLTYLLVKELLALGKNKENKKQSNGEIIALLAAFLLAISPLSIQFSRVAFEANLAATLNIAGVFLFLKGLNRPHLLSVAAVAFSLSIYTYQSEKLFVPLLVLILLSIFWKQIFNISKKYLLAAFITFCIVSLPLGVFLVTDEKAFARAQGVSFFSDKTALLENSIEKLERDKANNDWLGLLMDNRRVIYAKSVIAGYLSHYDLNWLFITGDKVERHHAPYMGLLYLFELPFLLIGIYIMIFAKFIDKKAKLLVLLWFLTVPIPASVTTGLPHAVRTLNFLPTFQIFTALGLITAFLFINQIKFALLRNVIYVGFILFAVGNIAYYLNQYFVQQNYYFTKEWQYGYKELVNYLQPIHSDYKKVVVSNQKDFDQSYIFFLFYLKYDAKQYLQEGGTQVDKKFSNFEFTTLDTAQKSTERPMLLVGAEQDFPANEKKIKIIKYPDGKNAMFVVEKK